MIDIKLHNPVMLVKQIPEVAEATGLTQEEIRRLMFSQADIVLTDIPEYSKYSVVNKEQIKKAQMKADEHLTGMEAICWLCKEKKVSIPFVEAVEIPASVYEEFPRVWMDISMLCNRIENKNRRIAKLEQIEAPEILCKNEQRLLLEAVNDLEDTSWREPIRWENGRLIRCLADIEYSLLTGWSEEMLNAWAQEQLLQEAAVLAAREETEEQSDAC